MQSHLQWSSSSFYTSSCHCSTKAAYRTCASFIRSSLLIWLLWIVLISIQDDFILVGPFGRYLTWWRLTIIWFNYMFVRLSRTIRLCWSKMSFTTIHFWILNGWTLATGTFCGFCSKYTRIWFWRTIFGWDLTCNSMGRAPHHNPIIATLYRSRRPSSFWQNDVPFLDISLPISWVLRSVRHMILLFARSKRVKSLLLRCTV